MPKDFDFFYLDGFGWSDLLDFLRIPHYSNEHRGAQAPSCFEVRACLLTNPELPEEAAVEEYLLVVWPLDKPRPTDEQIQAAVDKDHQDP